MAFSMRPAYHAAGQREWKPLATYWLLGTIGAFFVAQMVVLNTYGEALYRTLFVINTDWPWRPWSLVTSTLSHGGIAHLAFNGIVLFFFGPALERIIGTRRYVVLFFVSGAIAGILQVTLSWVLFDEMRGGLGASGALMMIFGALMVLMPRQQILIWGILPVPFWAAGVGFALLDVLGAFNPDSGIGNFAHLSGMALGLFLGWRIRTEMRERGLHLMQG